MYKLYLSYYKKGLLFKGLTSTSLEAYSFDVLQFCTCCELWRGKDAINNSKKALENFFNAIRGEYSAKSIKRKMTSVKGFLDFLYNAGIVKDPTYKDFRFKVKAMITVPKFVLKSDIRKMVHHYEVLLERTKGLPEYYENVRRAAIFEFMYLTGVRVEELCSIKTRDIYIDDGAVIINGKGGKQRLIPFAITKSKFLEAYYNEFKEVERKSGFFFVNKWGKKISTQSVRQLVVRLRKEIGCDYDITPHMFRHTLATNLLENGVNLRIVQEILGHSSIKTTEIYTHVSIKHAKEMFFEKHPYNFMY